MDKYSIYPSVKLSAFINAMKGVDTQAKQLLLFGVNQEIFLIKTTTVPLRGWLENNLTAQSDNTSELKVEITFRSIPAQR